MKFDDLLLEVGEFGSYQKWVYLFVCIPGLSVGAVILLNVIILGIPDHRCKIPGLDNDTWDTGSPEHQALVRFYIPPSDTYPFDRCHLYDRDNSTVHANTSIHVPMVKCKEWVYSTSIFQNTFTQQINLVCDDALLVSLAQTIFYAGVLVGSIVLGQVSDLLGRKKTFYIGLLVLTLATVFLTFAPEFYSFVVIYFIIGLFSTGTMIAGYVIGMEFVGPSKRLYVGAIIQVFVATGGLYLSIVSYLLQDWRKIQLAIGVPGIVYIVYICIIPESPRWLLRNGKREEASAILTQLAKKNGKPLKKEILELLEADKNSSKGKIWQLFSTKVLAFRTCILFMNWFVVSMAYYGVILNVGHLGDSFYLNLGLMQVVEYPGKLVSIFLLLKFGRKQVYISYMLVGGLLCVGTIYPVIKKDADLNWLLVTLSIAGKLCVSSGFEVLYLLSSELFPTVVRNVGMGASSACARAGSMVAPYIVQLADLMNSDWAGAIPLTVFGVAAIIGGLLSFTLPETANKKLPDSIEEADNLSGDSNQDTNIQVPKIDRSEYTEV